MPVEIQIVSIYLIYIKNKRLKIINIKSTADQSKLQKYIKGFVLNIENQLLY